VDSKAKAGIIIALIGIIGTAATGSITGVFDFSTTNIGQIGDNIFNNYLADQGIDLEEFRRLCESGEVHEEIKQYCGLV